MTNEDPRTDWRQSAFWLDRLAVALLIVALRAVDFLVLLLRPRLFFAYLRLRLADVSASAYETAEAARPEVDEETSPWTYGETPVISALWLFRRAGVGRGSRVVDLGAGRGVPLLAARYLGAEARGVELLAEQVRHAAGGMRWAGISLRQGNATQEPVADATHLLLAWTCFTPAVRRAIEARLDGLRDGTIVIGVDAAPRGPRVQLVSQVKVPLSWGWTPVWICRVGDAEVEG